MTNGLIDPHGPLRDRDGLRVRPISDDDLAAARRFVERWSAQAHPDCAADVTAELVSILGLDEPRRAGTMFLPEPLQRDTSKARGRKRRPVTGAERSPG